MSAVSVLSVIVVALYTLHAIASTSRRTWRGHTLRFVGLALSLASVFAGAVGVVWGVPWGGHAAVFGAALYMLVNKRKCTDGEGRAW